ncbi:tetratricopeptide (TPR) repeat protein [Catenulispora sp. GAS73]|uniref:tetratricopeptide repeat protein n=1 Tax=Catenulispora sp. GAS73 TaxID=3156269 RepID=UPI003513D4E7
MSAEQGYGALSEPLARQLHELVRAAFAADGLEVAFKGQIAIDGAGRLFWLPSLVADCVRTLPDTESWPVLVRERVAGMVRSISTLSRLEAHGLEHAHSTLIPILLDESVFDDPGRVAHAQVVVPGIRLFTALNLPEGVHVLSASGEADLGGSPVVRQRAMENLAKLEFRGRHLVQSEDGGRFHLLIDASPYTASLVSVLSQLAAALTGRPLPPEGALVAVPTRQHLLVHPLEDLSVFAASLNAMGQSAQTFYDQADDPLSPSVYWWRPRKVVQVTSVENGEPTITIDEEFQAVLERMEGRPAPRSVEDLVNSPGLAQAMVARGEVELDFDLVLELSTGLLGRGDLGTAHIVAERAAASHDAKVRTAGQIAAAFLDAAEGKTERALSELESVAASADPDVRAEAAALSGLILEQQNRVREAEQQYRMALDTRRPSAVGQAALGLARLLIQRGDHPGTVAALKAARECGDRKLAAQAATELGAACEQSGDIEGAIRYYREAVDSRVPEVAPRAAFYFGELLRGRGELEEARELLESVATGTSAFAPAAVVRLGLLHLKTGDPREAANCFRAAAYSTDPDAAAQGHLHLGIMAAQEGYVEQALDLLETVGRSANGQVRTSAADALRQLREAR